MPFTPGLNILNGKYTILRLIGEGGMARVWLAEEVTFGQRQVAIKEPHGGLGSTDAQEIQQRFLREVKVSAALAKTHTPNIVQALTAERWTRSSGCCDPAAGCWCWSTCPAVTWSDRSQPILGGCPSSKLSPLPKMCSRLWLRCMRIRWRSYTATSNPPTSFSTQRAGPGWRIWGWRRWRAGAADGHS